MNQILVVKDNKNDKNQEKTIKKKKFAFKLQFSFSIALIIIFVSFFIYYRQHSQNFSNEYASRLSNNYQVYRLYSNENSAVTDESLNSSIIGTIEIPSISVSYPILSNLTESLLKISPCRFNGDIADDSNLCIAGHNYDNDSFFSKIQYLKSGNKIVITDNSNTVYNFIVFDNYEVAPSDLSPIYNKTNNFKKELTLVTCNNHNNKRIIVKAKLEE